MDYQNLLESVKNRRSIRRFKPEPIPDEYVEKIIEVARWAPSGANSQPWEFIVIKEKELKDRIVALIKEQAEHARKMELTREEGKRMPTVERTAERPGFQDAPVFIVLCGDVRTQEAYPLIAFYSHRDSNFVSSLANTFLYMHLAAASLGLGSQWVTSSDLPLVQSQLKQLLGMPRELVIYDMIAIGYPAYKPNPRLLREKDEMVHYERFNKAKFRTEEQITSFIAEIHQEGGRPSSP